MCEPFVESKLVLWTTSNAEKTSEHDELASPVSYVSMESLFILYRADGRKRVYRRRGERFTDACVMKTDRFGGGLVMVWGGIAHGLKNPLIVVKRN